VTSGTGRDRSHGYSGKLDQTTQLSRAVAVPTEGDATLGPPVSVPALAANYRSESLF